MTDRISAQRILVINPNASAAVTRTIDVALEPLRFAGGPHITVDYLRDGPPGLVTQQDADGIILPMSRRIRDDASDAFVIACFREPGLHSAREAANGRPVFGIAECAILAALTMGERFGIIALAQGSVTRQQRLTRMMGVSDRYAGSVPAHLTPTEATEASAHDQLVAAGRKLVDQHGADVLVLGCPSMAGHRKRLEDMVGRPVMEPTQQTVAMAMGRLLLARSECVLSGRT